MSSKSVPFLILWRFERNGAASFPGSLFSASLGNTISTSNEVLSSFEFLVSKEAVVLRRWETSKQKFGFIKRVDKGEITTVKDLES